MSKLVLHLGLHKTATTFLQNELNNIKGTLESCGVGYLPLDNTRKHITSKLGSLFSDFKSVNSLFKEDLGCVIISDENIIGGTEKPKINLFYPDAINRIKKVISLFPKHEVEVYITLRDFRTFTISMYSEYLRHYKYVSYENYMESLDIKELSWFPLIESIVSLEGVSKVYILNFDEFPEKKTLLINSITQGVVSAFEFKQSPSRKTLTTEVIKFLSLFPERSVDVLRKMEACKYIYGKRFQPYSNGQLLNSKCNLINEIELIKKLNKVEII